MKTEQRVEGDIRKLTFELAKEFGWDYIGLALKKINEQQQLGLKIQLISPDFHPILKVMDLIMSEYETVLFDPNAGIDNLSELRNVLETILKIGNLRAVIKE